MPAGTARHERGGRVRMSERAVLKELVGHNVIKRGEDEGDVLQGRLDHPPELHL